jgi:hypothetical protein
MGYDEIDTYEDLAIDQRNRGRGNDARLVAVVGFRRVVAIAFRGGNSLFGASCEAFGASRCTSRHNAARPL